VMVTVLRVGGTSIRTLSTVDLHENVSIGSEVVTLKSEIGEKKWNLLNLNGYELSYFDIGMDEKVIRTRRRIDREEMLRRKECFDVTYCLIELHVLINDGEEYLVIPIHIVE
jgi:hypothetical protein